MKALIIITKPTPIGRSTLYILNAEGNMAVFVLPRNGPLDSYLPYLSNRLSYLFRFSSKICLKHMRGSNTFATNST